MKVGSENRKKTMWAGALMVLAVLFVGNFLYKQLAGDDTPKTPPPPPTGIARAFHANNAEVSEQTNASNARSTGGNAKVGTMPTGNAAGPQAKKIGSSSGNLDPTLDESAMLRTEHLVYSGSGRNIFSLVYVPPVAIPKAVTDGRNHGPVAPTGPPPPPPPPPTCPPSCPPINLKFFGTATRPNGSRQAFLLQGEDVFLASPGDIVARKYKIVSIAANSIQVEDLTNNNTQTLPLQSN
jgi:hypothetical protein